MKHILLPNKMEIKCYWIKKSIPFYYDTFERIYFQTSDGRVIFNRYDDTRFIDIYFGEQ